MVLTVFIDIKMRSQSYYQYFYNLNLTILIRETIIRNVLDTALHFYHPFDWPENPFQHAIESPLIENG